MSRKRTAFTIIGLAVSASWLTLVAIYIGDEVGWDNMVLMLPHEIGFTLFGVFAPLAFLWLLLIYFSAERRLSDATRSLERRLDQLIYPSDDAAARAIQEHEVWTLAGRDREVFVRALLNPPAPNAHMKAAVKRYKRRLGAL